MEPVPGSIISLSHTRRGPMGSFEYSSKSASTRAPSKRAPRIGWQRNRQSRRQSSRRKTRRGDQSAVSRAWLAVGVEQAGHAGESLPARRSRSLSSSLSGFWSWLRSTATSFPLFIVANTHLRHAFSAPKENPARAIQVRGVTRSGQISERHGKCGIGASRTEYYSRLTQGVPRIAEVPGVDRVLSD